MVKVIYYVRTNDKDTLKPKLYKRDFIKLFDEIFKNYTLVEAISKYTNNNKETIEELSLIVITFIEEYTVTALKQHIQHNCSILKDKLNQESILVDVCKPEVMFL